MKILFVGYNLQAGGIQRALVNMLDQIKNDTELEIDLFVFSNKGIFSDEIPSEINHLKGNYFLELVATPFSEVLKKGKWMDKIVRILLVMIVRLIGSRRLFKLLFLFQGKLEVYDVAISYFNDVPGEYFNKGSNQFVSEHIKAKRRIGWIHTDPVKAQFDRQECLETYRNYDAIVNVSKASKEKFDIFVPEYKEKSHTVYNFFPVDQIQNHANAYPVNNQTDIINFITVARIDNISKRIDRIIKVVAMLKRNGHTDFKWRIIGSGPDLEKNMNLALDYGVMDYIEFLGAEANPYPHMKYADVFVLTSDYEGFPMVIGEAQVLKVPIITTAYAAAKEQVKDDGIIVNNDEQSLYQALTLILEDDQTLTELKRNAIRNNVENELALNQFYSLLK